MANGKIVGRSVLTSFVGSLVDAMGRFDAGESDCCSVVGAIDGI